MKALGVAILAGLSVVGVAHAADVLPTTKPTPAPPENCFATFWTYLNSSAADCPLKLRTVHALRDA